MVEWYWQGKTSVLWTVSCPSANLSTVNLSGVGRDRPQGNPCEICGVQSGAGIGLFSEYFKFSSATVIPPSLHTPVCLDAAFGVSITKTQCVNVAGPVRRLTHNSVTHTHCQMYQLGSDLCYCQCLYYVRLDFDAVLFCTSSAYFWKENI
jgi:hypothetical protein